MKKLNFITYDTKLDSTLSSSVLYRLSMEFYHDNFLYFDSCNRWLFSGGVPSSINNDLKYEKHVVKVPPKIPEDIVEIVISEITKSKSKYIFFDGFLFSIKDVSKRLSIIQWCMENDCTVFSTSHSEKLKKIPIDIYDQYKMSNDVLSANNINEIIVYVESLTDPIQEYRRWAKNFYSEFINDKIDSIFK